jgi:hypothetical protein
MMNQNVLPYRIDFDAIEWSSPFPGIRHKVYQADGQILRLVEYSQDMAPHWCSRGHFGLILEGRFEIAFAGATHVFESGAGVFIPGGENHRHRARALTDTVRAIFVETV